MPIGDLLASIAGEEAKPSVSSATSREAPHFAKRKPEEEICPTSVKSPRHGPVTAIGQSRQAPDLLKASSSRVPERPSHAQTSSSVATALRTKHSTVPRVPDRPVRSSTTKQPPASSPTYGGRPPPARTLADRSSISDARPKPEPKKRSFAEIMARAKAAQAAAPALGRIQHKTLERGASKRDRDEANIEEARSVKSGTRVGGSKSARAPHAAPGGKGSSPSQDRHRRGTAPVTKKPVANKPKKAPVVEEKRVKKAALATTGYTGTARPRPAASSKPNGPSTTPGSAIRQRPGDRPRYGGALSRSRQRFEDEDDDMDDFIEYDEDEEPPYGHGGGYDSIEEDESDMEAGISDIDQEERKAELFARREDQEQEALEKRMKREKEERKRKLSEAARMRAR